MEGTVVKRPVCPGSLQSIMQCQKKDYIPDVEYLLSGHKIVGHNDFAIAKLMLPYLNPVPKWVH